MSATTPQVAACIVVAALYLASAVTPGEAQTPAQTTAPAATQTRPETTAAVPASNVSLAERLSYTDGKPLVGAVVTVTATSQRIAVRQADTTDASGSYHVDSLPKGEYSVVVTARGGQSTTRRMRLNASVNHDVTLPIAPPEDTPNLLEILWTAGFIVLYFFTIAFVRWHNIARAVNEVLQRQLFALQLRAVTEVGDKTTPQLDELRKVVEKLRNDLSSSGRPKALDFMLWSRGRENGLWGQLHEIERQLAAFLAPPEQVEVYLRTTQAELRRLNSAGSVTLADAIADSLKLTEPVDERARRRFLRARQALLGRALALLFTDRDEKFASLMEWQNKAGWLIFAALLIVMFLTITAGHAILFLAGAAGGFLSRLERTIKREDMPLDYGASWTTLFLSPVLGALTGWFGIALITLLTDDRVNLLGSAFRLVDWTHPHSPWTIGIAFVLGFSERLFDSIVSVLETHTDQSKEKAAVIAGGGGSAAAPAVAGNGAAGTPAAAGSAAPVIDTVSLELRATGAARDAIVISGGGFDPKSTVLVNDRARAAAFESTQRMTMDASSDDVKTISIGGDFNVVVRSGNGVASAPFSFTAVLTP